MSSSRLKEADDHGLPPAEEAPVIDLVVDVQSEAFKLVRNAYETGTLLDVTNMTDEELEKAVLGQA